MSGAELAHACHSHQAVAATQSDQCINADDFLKWFEATLEAERTSLGTYLELRHHEILTTSKHFFEKQRVEPDLPLLAHADVKCNRRPPRRFLHTEAMHSMIQEGSCHAVSSSVDPSASSSIEVGKDASRSNIAVIDKSLADLEVKQKKRFQQRLRRLMDIKRTETHVRPEHIDVALRKKAPSFFLEQWNEDSSENLIRELLRVQGSLMQGCVDIIPEKKERRSGGGWTHAIERTESIMNRVFGVAPSSGERIDLESFTTLMILPNLTSYLGPERVFIQKVQGLLVQEDVADVIAACISTTTDRGSDGIASDNLHPRQAQFLKRINQLVGFSVFLSIPALGMSLDVEPESLFWTVFEGVVTLILVAEFIFKLHLFGLRTYLQGPDRFFNILDMSVTCLAIIDIALSVVLLGNDVPASRLALIARIMRLTRVTRLLKALNMPLFRGLANMLLGFVIALPNLAWILLLLIAYMYVVGIMFRATFGPTPGQNLMSKCPSGDEVTPADDPQCQIHFLYGEEFFGTVPASMFTVFRCTLGDCNTRAGKSLTSNFAMGYGARFYLIYVVGMIGVMFGLFQIINAIFVESVISGLKRKDVQKRYAMQYDARFVKDNLERLVNRLNVLCTEPYFTHEDFVTVVNDEVVSSILDDLDVTQYSRESLFDVVDSNGNGRITQTELMHTLMMLRGEPQKSDTVSCSVLLRGLRDRTEQFHQILLDNQRQLLHNQSRMLSLEVNRQEDHCTHADWPELCSI